MVYTNDLFSAQSTVIEKQGEFFQLMDHSSKDITIKLIHVPMIPDTSALNNLTIPVEFEIMQSRPDIQIAKLQYELAQLDLKIFQNNTLPSLSISSQGSIFGKDRKPKKSIRYLKSFEFSNVSIGINFSTPIKQIKSVDKELPYRVKINKNQFKVSSTKDKVRREIKSAQNNLDLTCRKYMSARHRLKSAQQNFLETEALYNNSFTSLDNYLKSLKNLETAEFRLVELHCEYTINFYKLEKSTGLLLKRFIQKYTR